LGADDKKLPVPPHRLASKARQPPAEEVDDDDDNDADEEQLRDLFLIDIVEHR
jgi:hypothetical protein